MHSLSFPLGLFRYRNVYGLNNNIPHHQAWGGVVGHKVPDSGFPASLRNESREFLLFFNRCLWKEKDGERADVLGSPNKVDL